MISNKDKVAEAAMELFHEQGFRATGIGQILSVSGVCKSNFYYHFKSKDELAIYVVEQKIKHIMDSLIHPVLKNTTTSVNERITSLFNYFMLSCEETEYEKGCFFGNFAAELGDSNEKIRQLISDFFLDLQQYLEIMLLEGQFRSEIKLRGMAAHELASSVVSLYQGGMLLVKGHKEISPLQHNLKFILQFIEADEEVEGYG